MPAAFDAAVKAGGKVRTVTGPDKKFGLEKGQYLHIVFTKGGKMIRGEVRDAKHKVDALDKKR